MYISWNDVQEFIETLNAAAGERRYRLPTEAEWEYACRAGTTTPWSFGDNTTHLEYFAWYLSDDATGVQAVGLKRANPWGLRDMHGNVGEWVQDWYDPDYYAKSPRLDPQGPSWPPIDAPSWRVIRGGSFYDPSGLDTRSASRSADTNAYTGAYTGFRLVRDEVPQEPPTRTASLPGGTEIKFVRVEPGVFQMGSDHGDANERPVHEVEISTGFWLGQYEVTKAQWEAVMEPPAKFASRWAALSESHPAIGISWLAAQDFIDSLNAAGERWYRLPSEAEWEYACRAGMPTRWSFGDDVRRLADYAWYNTSGVNEVGQKRPNFWGLYDMHGNVQEWVQDWYGEDYYANSPVMDPAGPDTGNARVRRGGIYSNEAESVRSARREGSDPTNEDVSFGFRLLMLDRPEELPVDEGGTVGDDRAVLVALYEATDGANWEDNRNWLSEAPLDEWDGVTTDEEGRVLELDLRNNELTGAIPAELGQLKKLERLFLGYNDLTGSIPAELGQLKNLTHLYLDDNDLTDSIPAELGQLKNLEYLNLDDNDLTGCIPSGLKYMRDALDDLGLSFCR